MYYFDVKPSENDNLVNCAFDTGGFASVNRGSTGSNNSQHGGDQQNASMTPFFFGSPTSDAQSMKNKDGLYGDNVTLMQLKMSKN